MAIKTINTKKAPLPIGPYSQAVVFNDLIFCSGQIGIEPETGELKKTLEEQTVQIMENLKQILEEAGSNFENVLKTTIYLTDINYFSKVNEIYSSYFKKTKPARSTTAVSNLPKGALVEVDLIAFKNQFES